MKENIIRSYNEKIKTPDVAVSFFWKGFALFLMGVVVGFLIAPVKKGLRVGCGNGNNSPVTDNECSIEGSVDCGDCCGE